MHRATRLLEALFELLRLRAQTLVIERLHALFERINLFTVFLIRRSTLSLREPNIIFSGLAMVFPSKFLRSVV